MTYKDIRWQLLRRAQIWRRARRDDDLYNHLVGSLFASKSSLNSANIMGTAIAVAGFVLTGNRVFIMLTALTLMFGIARTAVSYSFVRQKDKLKRRADCALYEQRFFLYSVLFTAAFGMSCYELIRYPVSSGTHAIATGAGVGYAMGVVARNAGRPGVVIVQVVFVIMPMLIGFALMHNTYGNTAALLLAATIVTTISVTFSLHKNVIAVYNANKATLYLAAFDKLTGLMNRHTFSEHVADAIAQEPANKFAILYLDLDRFKEINDTMGHAAGDAVIVEVARRLRAMTRGGDLIARFGGDEFVVKLNGARFVEIEDIIQRIIAKLSMPLTVDGKALMPSASIGVAVFPDNGVSADNLIKKADIALYDAKRDGGGTFRVFRAETERELQNQRTIRHEIQTAVDQREFIFHYQPIYDLNAKSISSVEALLRWNHPTRGVLGPDAFISIAEQTLAIVDIGEQMIEAACELAMKLPAVTSVAVNLSTVQFHEPDRLVASVCNALHKTGLQASRLHLELTETLLLSNTPAVRATLNTLAALGVKLVLDDFGTGYSSLSYLQDFPFSKIKIDKKFTASLCTSAASAAIIKGIVQIANDLSLETVIEGIETAEQESYALVLGSTQGQGFLFSRPLADHQLLHLVDQNRGAPPHMSLAS